MANSDVISFPPWHQVRHLKGMNNHLKLQLDKLKSSERRDSSEVVSHHEIGNSIDTTKINARLKEVFKEKIAQYREAVYLLTGYRIDLTTSDGVPRAQTKLRLRSMYAERPDDVIEFLWRDSVSLELLDSSFIRDHMDQKCLDYLRISNSVPGFLAAISLDLLEKQTFV